MKKLSFFALAIAGMLFTACSDKDMAVADGQEKESLTEGYMALNINLPTAPIVRAANDNFDDGDSKEYKVTDCALLLFQGTTMGKEEDAVLIDAQQILLPFDESKPDVDGDIVTTSYQATAKVKGYTNGNKLYALAFLNFKNIMSISNEGNPTIAGKLFKSGSTKLSEIRALTTDADLTTRGGSQNYFFMTNAVLSKAQGGNVATAPTAANTFQLAVMDPNKIKENAEAAKKDPAGEIYVERAVAKATLKVTATAVNLSETKSLPIDVKETKWTIDNIEPKTYVARNPGDLSYIGYRSGGIANYRFVGNVSTNNSVPNFTDSTYYRTYWCIDPQYNDMTGEGEEQTIKNATGMVAATPASFVSVGDNIPLYCYENTFDVPHQSYANTTRAIIRIVLTGVANQFWTVNDGPEMYEQVSDATSYVVNSVVNNTDVIETFQKGLNEGQTDYDINSSTFNISFDRNKITGQYEVTKIKLSSDVTAQIGTIFKSDFSETIEKLFDTDFINTLNDRYVIRQYNNGEMFYEARFKHFAGSGEGNYVDLAPWNTKGAWETPAPAGGSTAAAYPGTPENAANNYLGRYGMVRNNWYDVDVTAFKKLGYPADPSGQVNNPKFEDPDTPDDNIIEYISAKINVLSWAKRIQSWGF